MTVRVNKPAFNIREKLSELERPIGVKGNELMGAETAQDARDLVSAGRKNMVINGDMRISQRVGTTATTTGSGTFVLDRMRWENSNSGSTTAQQVTDAPPGFHNSMKITVTGTDTSIAAGEYSYFRHLIEGNNMNHLEWGSSNAKTVTLSFWAKSSIVGDHGGSFWNNNFNRSFPFNYRINVADTWEYKSITVPGCPDGVWETGTARGMNIGFTQLSGSTYTGTPNQWNSAGDIAPTTHVNLLATSGATLYITGIQLEVGRNATEFEHRSYGEELALCQRYCVVYGGTDESHLGTASAYTSTNINLSLALPTTMRTGNPSISRVTSGGNWLQAYIGQSGNNSNSTPELGETTNNNVLRIYLTSSHSGLSTGQALWCQVLPNAKLIVSAEL